MKVGEENLAVLRGIIARELFVEGCERGDSVVSLDASPVVEGLDGDARDVLALRVESHGRGGWQRSKTTRIAAGRVAWRDYVQCVAQDYAPMHRVVHAIAELDALTSLADVASLPGYTRPDIAEDDEVVPVENSLLLRAALRRAGVPVETHLFTHGGHGFALRRAAAKPAELWPELFVNWTRSYGL